MCKKSLFILIVAGITAAATILLKSENARSQVRGNIDRGMAAAKGKTKQDEDNYLNEKTGHSDPNDIDDNKMVSEGAVNSVQYFNNTQESGEEPVKSTHKDSSK